MNAISKSCANQGTSQAYPGYSLAVKLDAPRDDNGPVFAEPWQAQAFAIVCELHRGGLFTWQEWTECFGAKRALATEDSDGAASRYYVDWLDALEEILCIKGFTSVGKIQQANEAWTAAALRTPHGEPIFLNPDIQMLLAAP